MATIYIDPSSATNGAGTIGDPKNTWAFTLVAGNTYLQRVGTTWAVGAATFVAVASLTGSESAPTVIGTYALPGDTASKATIDGRNMTSSSRGAIDIRDSSWVTVSGFIVLNAGKYSTTGMDYALQFLNFNAGVLVTRSENVRIFDNECHHNINGVAVWTITNPGYKSNIIIEDNDLHDNVRAGVLVSNNGTSAAPVLCSTNGLKIRRNAIYNTGINLWDPKANTGLGTDSASPWLSGSPNGPGGGISILNFYQLPFSSPATSLAINTEICDNEVYNNLGYGIAASSLGPGSLVARNHVYGNGCSFDGSSLDGTYDTHSIFISGCFNTVVECNHVHDNGGLLSSSYGSGVGIFLDQCLTLSPNSSTTPYYMRIGADNIVRRNIVHDQWQGLTAASNPSAGIISFINNRSKIYSNVIYGCRQGVTVGGGTFVSDVSKSANVLKISAISGNGTTVTATTQGDHGLTVGDVLSFSLSSTSGYNVSPATVLTTPATNQFTYAGTGTGTPGTMPTLTFVMKCSAVQVFNNTIDDISEQGLAGFGYSTDTAFTNNVVRGAKWALHKQTTGSALGIDTALTATYNNIYGSVEYNYIGGTYTASASNPPGSGQTFSDLGALPATNVTTYPGLSSTYRLAVGSPLLAAGAHLGHFRDVNGVQRPNPPSIGAYDVATMRAVG